METFIYDLSEFLTSSPTAFHAADTISRYLDAEEFIKLNETDKWDIKPGGKYFVTRNQSSIIAFQVGEDLSSPAFRITASHSDSPAFKIKENAEIKVRDKYTKLNTEGYGGMICSSWLDRPLSIAGRVLIKDGDRISSRLLNIDKDLLMIPGLAIHMDRTQNEGHKYNKQIDMLPLIADASFENGGLDKLIASELGVSEANILARDLYLYNRMQPAVWGAYDQFYSAARLDDLQCAFASLVSFIGSCCNTGINVYCCFDNEEVGSQTKQGASSTFMQDILRRAVNALDLTEEDYNRAIAGSFMISCDNAHAVHPNFPDKTDASNCVYLNEGVVIKSHAGQKYTSDAASIALFKSICKGADVPVQYFANRSDAAGGSTLGNLAMSQVSVNAVDVGLAQLAMHSSYETAGIKDAEFLVRALKAFYSSIIETTGDGQFSLK